MNRIGSLVLVCAVALYCALYVWIYAVQLRQPLAWIVVFTLPAVIAASAGACSRKDRR